VAPNDNKKVVASDGLTHPLMQVMTSHIVRCDVTRTSQDETRVLELYPGLSSEIALPAGIDLIVHEILGNVASAEGAIIAINELHGRNGLTSHACRVLPIGAGTLLAPTSVLTPCVVERLLMFQKTGCSMARPKRLYAARGVPSENFLAPPQLLEWLDFRKHVPVMSTRTCRFHTDRAGWFDGLHMHLLVHVDETASIDTYHERTTWTCTYVRLLDGASAIWLAAGALIECICNVDASTHCPAYSISVSVSHDGSSPLVPVSDFSWRGDG